MTSRLEATREWVKEFNAIPQGMIERLVKLAPDEWEEITLPTVGDPVCTCNDEKGKITRYYSDGDQYRIELDDGRSILLGVNEFWVVRYYDLPIWGTMWSFGESIDEWWLEEDGGLRAMSDCGFKIYKHEEYGYFFGIDGAGYDFYEAHWCPLYDKRGLNWHKKGA